MFHTSKIQNRCEIVHTESLSAGDLVNDEISDNLGCNSSSDSDSEMEWECEKSAAEKEEPSREPLNELYLSCNDHQE